MLDKTTTRYGPNKDTLRHFSFSLRPHRSTPLLAVRLRARLPADRPKLFIAEAEDLVKWASYGATWAFWVATHPHTTVGYKLRIGHTQRTLLLPRFILGCGVGEATSYLGSPFDLRKENLKRIGKCTAREPVAELLVAAQRAGGLRFGFVEWERELVEPDRVCLETFTEKSRLACCRFHGHAV